MTARALDVLVVGLGPAGSTAAAAAASRGATVLAIDRKREAGRPVQCAEYVPAMLDQELDGLEPITRQRIRAMTTFVEDAAPDVTPGFRGRMIERALFDLGLVERASRAGADCRFRLALETLAADGEALLTDGSVIRPRVVIGADGPRSAVGRAIGSVNVDLVETRQATVPLTAPFESTDVYLSADIAGGYAWLFPKGAVANLGVGVEPARRARLKPLLEALHARLAAAGRVGTDVLGLTGGAIPVGGLLEPEGRLGGVPVMLAGDACGLTNPVTGAGIASAVLSGRMAGEAAAAWLTGDGQAIAGFADETRALFQAALARAVERRRALLAEYHGGCAPSPAALRRGWIAYPEYWAA